jgi:predicted  nucleic acid-binding Zn-ribbon protein
MYTKPPPGKSVQDVMPPLAAEWHPTLNGDLTPADVLPGSSANVWWRCSACGHEWRTTVSSRGRRGSGCRKCWFIRKGVLRSTPKPGQSLQGVHPDVAAEWHPTMNGGVKPTDVRPASNKRAWWRCKEGHEWSVPPCDRRRGERCPTCADIEGAIKKSTPKLGQSLQDLRPDLAAEWHPTRNDPLTPSDVNPGSKTRRWWRCRSCGHDWQTDPDHRTRRSHGCPSCAPKKQGITSSTPKPGESLGEKMPELAAEWHPTLNAPMTPFDVRPRGGASVWWRCRLGHEWKAKVAPRAVGIGCPRCSTIGVSQRETRLRFELAAAGLPVAHDHPRIAVGGRRPVQADIVMPSLRLVVEYDGSYYHASKVRADRDQTTALTEAGWTVLRVREEPLPSLGGHEVFVSPTEPIKSLALKVLHALDSLGYVAPMHDQYRQDPDVWAEYDANEALNKIRARSLVTENPLLAQEFDQAKNGMGPEAVHPGSMSKSWWQCRMCGHEWKSVVASRVAGRGCPRCGVARRAAQRAVPLPGNSFEDLHPDVAKEWHPTRNGTLTPSQVAAASNKVVWWQCPSGHEWQARVAFRREYGRCRECRRDGTLPYRLDKP